MTDPPRMARVAVTYTFAGNGALFGAWAPRIPEVKADLELSAGALGVALLGIAIGSMVSLPLGGAAATRFGSAAATRITFVATCALAVLPGLAGNFGTLLGALVVWGLAIGGCDVTMNSQGVSVERRYGRSVLSGFHAWFSLGALVGAGVGSAGAALAVPIAGQQLGLAALLLLGWLPLAGRFIADPVGTGEKVPLFARPTGGLLALGAAAFIVLMAEGSVGDWSAVYLREELGAGAGAAGAAFIAFSATMTLGRLVGDWLITRFGARQVVVALTLLGALGLGGGLLTSSLPAAVGGFALLGVGLSCTFPALLSVAGSGTGHPGPAIAAVTTCGYTGFLVGPPGIGALADHTSLRVALGALAVPIALAGLLTVRTRRPRPDPTP